MTSITLYNIPVPVVQIIAGYFYTDDDQECDLQIAVLFRIGHPGVLSTLYSIYSRWIRSHPFAMFDIPAPKPEEKEAEKQFEFYSSAFSEPCGCVTRRGVTASPREQSRNVCFCCGGKVKHTKVLETPRGRYTVCWKCCYRSGFLRVGYKMEDCRLCYDVNLVVPSISDSCKGYTCSECSTGV